MKFSTKKALTHIMAVLAHACALSYAALGCTAFAHAQIGPSDDGNHPTAKSEAWTWMGHLQEIQGAGSSLSLGPNGVGFMYYYTRNDTGDFGSLDFRSSTLTTTVNGVGQSFSTQTIYNALYPNAQFITRTGSLDLSFNAGKIHDVVQTQPMTALDTANLNTLLTLFPGLSPAANFAVKKVAFNVGDHKGGTLSLTFYSIWPTLYPPPNGQIQFLGESDTYTFAEPMLVASGTYNGKPVAGLAFLDRQWGAQYFGAKIFQNLSDMLKFGQALPYSHSWSAFHAYDQVQNTWSFFHIWHQYQRSDSLPDALIPYSGLEWTNGKASTLVDPSGYSWQTSGFVLQKGSNVMLDYALGRPAFFPSRFNFSVPSLNVSGELVAKPQLQSLNQPIYLYEGYASGTGQFNGDTLSLKGRFESARLLFRPQDYQEMYQTLQAQTNPVWQQPKLQSFLLRQIQSSTTFNPIQFLSFQIEDLAFLLNDLDLKLAIFGQIVTQDQPHPDPQDPGLTIYP